MTKKYRYAMIIIIIFIFYYFYFYPEWQSILVILMPLWIFLKEVIYE